MARRPEIRYPSARELAEDLRRFQTGRLVSAHVYSRGTLVKRWLRRYRAPVIVAAVALTLLAVVGVVSVKRVIERAGPMLGVFPEAHRDVDVSEMIPLIPSGKVDD